MVLWVPASVVDSKGRLGEAHSPTSGARPQLLCPADSQWLFNGGGGDIFKTCLEKAFPPLAGRQGGVLAALGCGLRSWGAAIPNVHLAFYAWTVLQLLGKFLTPGFSGERFVIRHHSSHPSQQPERHCLRRWGGEGKGYMQFFFLPSAALSCQSPFSPLPHAHFSYGEGIGLDLGEHSGVCRQRDVFC